MPEQAILRRPVLLASAGVVTATIFYFAYVAYTQKPRDTSKLHRSNAVRRTRRPWPRSHPAPVEPSGAVAEALRHLHSRNAAGQPYGRYENRLLFDLSQELLEQGRYDLLPSNIGPMIEDLRDARTFTDLEKETLAHHVQSMFVQNFLVEEFDPGFTIGEEVESLIHAFGSHGISEQIVRIMVERFDAGKPLTPVNWDLHEESRPTPDATQANQNSEIVTAQGAIEALTGPVDDDDSDSDWGINDNESDPGGSQGMLDLLYHIAGEQAKRDGLVHREVRCNSCNLVPIRGIRYHCANCFDYDLCETCEAQQVHHKSHVFYKIRIPAPSRGQIKHVAPVWYPGNPDLLPNSLPRELSMRLMQMTQMEKIELDSLYEQFKCLAGHHIPVESDPTQLGMAIDRKNFDFYFTTTSDDRPPPQSLIYDRIFAFYDANNDDLITFDEFVRGLSNLQNRTRAARARRLFDGYDLDGDGYVSRRDFLRMLRAYYAWHKEVERERVMHRTQYDLDEDIRDAINGTQPISAAFGWTDYAGHMSRGGQDKSRNANGDLEISSGPNGVLQNDLAIRADRTRAIGNAAVRGQTRLSGARSFRTDAIEDDPVLHLPYTEADFVSSFRLGDIPEYELRANDPSNHIYGWPPDDVPETTDVMTAIGADLPIDEIMDPVDRARVIYSQSQRLEAQDASMLADAQRAAVQERWRRRQFYLDEEEGMSRPPGYTEPNSSDEEPISDLDDEDNLPAQNGQSRRQSMRSRSSSKVRFDDSAIDTDHETRSNTSSRSVPINERWGGFDLSEAEKDIGREILYQTIQQGFNELLDPLFSQKEKEALEAINTKQKRQKWRLALDAYRQTIVKTADQQEDLESSPSSDTSSDTTSSPEDENLGSNPSSDTTNPVDPSNELPKQLADILTNGSPELENDNMNHQAASKSDSLNSVTAAVASSIELQDSTLPHLRPNDEPTAALLAIGLDNDKTDTELPPPDTTLATWLGHDAIDHEAENRGGYGRLSFREFQKRMLSESIGVDLDLNIDVDDNQQEIWNLTADLGKLSFLGNWLEMARF